MKYTCDYPGCSRPIQYYGYQHCYCVCDSPEHIKWGEAIEARIVAEEMDAVEEAYQREEG